jgi:outer membrane protein assembly factor BamB
MRALDWVSLDDVWSTNIDEIRNNQKVKRYMLPKPPMYSALGEVGLSSPAIVNDVVFVSTSLPAVYAFDSQTGLCLWQSPNFTPSSQAIMLGPAIYGDYLVIGDARGIENGNIYIYSLYP